LATPRESLTFNNLDEAVADAENLLNKGYDRTGNWDLAQICNHLAEWLKYPIDGYPPAPIFLKPVFWLMKVTFGKRMGQSLLQGGKMKKGLATAPQTVFPGGQDANAAVENFRQQVERWKAYSGPYHPSPIFGSFTQEEWNRGQCVHAAHHLSFLVPMSN
jgi:hypothetical protein